MLKPLRLNYLLSILIILFSVITNSCNKPTNDIQSNPIPDPTPNPIPTPTPTFTVDNKWECTVDGINYTGTIDTSFMAFNITSDQHPDTVIDCNGTADDKKANIHLRLIINRYSFAAYTNSSFWGHVLVIFDTVTTNTFIAESGQNNTINVVYNIDTVTSNKIKFTFTGTLAGSNSPHTITNGKMNFEIGKGDNEPKSFSFTAGSKVYAGYFNQAKFNSNTLILDGEPYGYYAGARFRLIIHTGASVKPGIYESSNAQAGFSFYSPSLLPYFVDDRLGNLKVTITSVNGNIVNGFFEGTNYDRNSPATAGVRISNGKLNCRIKNYQPYADSINKWEYIDENYVYMLTPVNFYGGNIVKASKTFARNRYYLTINGESDNFNSKFKLVIASNAPIDTGRYVSYPFSNSLDSLYVTSDVTNLLYIVDKFHPNVSCVIDSINTNWVAGKFSQIFPGDPYKVKRGTFKANF